MTTGNLLQKFTESLTFEVELSGLPPFTVAVGGDDPSPLVRALRPAVTVRANGSQLARIVPHGEPSAGFPTAAVAVGGAVLGVAVLTWLALRGLSK